MCTAIMTRSGDSYFGRNLDLERGFGAQAVLVPREFPLVFRNMGIQKRHFAMVGMAAVVDGYPLFAEAVNEKGLAMAGLNFPKNAAFPDKKQHHKDNIAPFEIIPWILSQAETLTEAQALLSRLCVIHEDFRADIPVTPLHWFLCDRTEAITLECTDDGMHIYENSVRVLTNDPQFPFQTERLLDIWNLTSQPQKGTVLQTGDKPFLSLGGGARGLPGDYSSSSRFVRAAWLMRESEKVPLSDEGSRVGRVFSILSAVAPIKGCVLTADGAPHYTLYSCGANLTKGIFYLRTAENPQICSVAFTEALCTGEEIIKPCLQRSDFSI